MNNNQKLIFPHIPKTAGISLYTSIKSKFTGTKRFGTHNSVKEFLNRKEKLDSIWFITGHIKFSQFCDKSIYGPTISILRDPIDRLESAFNYIQNSVHPNHQKLKVDNFKMFLKRIENNLGYYNTHCQYIGIDGTYESAKKNLNNHNIYLCPLENLSDMVDSLSSILGVTMKEFKSNKSIKNKNLDLKNQYLDNALISKLTREDQKLYDHARMNYNTIKNSFLTKNSKILEDISKEHIII